MKKTVHIISRQNKYFPYNRRIKMNIEFNVIAAFDINANHILMCKRRKNPYKGLYNLVGGKIENGEDRLSAAYRELEEETGISKNDIILTHLMDFTYYLPSIKVEVYVGRLNKEIVVYGDENDLEWIEINENFFDVSSFAGEGNIGHIMEHICLSKEILLK
jgi:8-oxo-dGTP diphosphatase